MADYVTATTYQLNGAAPAIRRPAEFQLVSQDWPATAMVPYLAYMPEPDRLAMLVIYGHPGTLYQGDPGLSFSDDHGATWTVPRRIPGAGMSLAYLGGGTLLSDRMASHDYGQTWEPLPAPPEREVWLPPLVDRDPKSGQATRLAKAFWSPLRSWGTGKTGPYAQGFIAFSDDQGRSWQGEIKVPQWLKVSEISLVRAANGDLVAACRLDLNPRFDPTAMDNYTGLGISLSSDDGRTWSDPFDPAMILFDWGRTHTWLTALPGGELVATYNVRRGYPDAPSGYPQFGIEAVVSRDHGRTWDLDHRYVLHVYEGNVAARDFWSFQGAPSNASTALLPGGVLLTAFNMEYAKIGLVRWRQSDQGLNQDRTHAQAAHDSALRNEFDPASLSGQKAEPTDSGNIALAGLGAQVTATPADYDPILVLANPYLYSQFPPGLVFEPLPAVVEITWSTSHQIDSVQILSGDPDGDPSEDWSRVPLDYQLECCQAGAWTQLAAPVVDATAQLAFTWCDEAKRERRTCGFVHRFDPIMVTGVRLTITRAAHSDAGRALVRRIEVNGS